jgi:hypothetical protein
MSTNSPIRPASLTAKGESAKAWAIDHGYHLTILEYEHSVTITAQGNGQCVTVEAPGGDLSEGYCQLADEICHAGLPDRIDPAVERAMIAKAAAAATAGVADRPRV